MPKIKNQTHLRDALLQLAKGYVEEVNSPDYQSGKIPKIPLNRTYVEEFHRIEEQFKRIYNTSIHDKIKSRDIFSLLRRVLQIIQDFKVPAKAAAWFECERHPQSNKLIFKKEGAKDDNHYIQDSNGEKLFKEANKAHPLVNYFCLSLSNGDYLQRYGYLKNNKYVTLKVNSEEFQAIHQSINNDSPQPLNENTLYENLLYFSQNFNKARAQMPWWQGGKYIQLAPLEIRKPYYENLSFFLKRIQFFHWLVDQHDLSVLPMKDCSKEEIYERMIEIINVLADTFEFLNECQSTTWKRHLGHISFKLFWWKSHTLWAQKILKKRREEYEIYCKQKEEAERKSNDRYYENYLNCNDVILHAFQPDRPHAHLIDARFEEDGLWIDHFDASESEHWHYNVKSCYLGRLRQAFGVPSKNKQELLEAIAKRFKGKTSYQDLKRYLRSQNIPYQEMPYRE